LNVTRSFSQDDIAAALGSEILSGKRKPRDRMPSDDEMFETYGVSRVVTREVVKTLMAKGLVVTRMGVGTIVQDPAYWNWFDADLLNWRVRLGLDAEFLVHLTQLRRIVEPAAASLAARARSREDLANLRDLIRAMENAVDNHRTFIEADLHFHLAISAASGNPFFRSFAGVIATALFGLLSMNSYAGRRTLAIAAAQHATIVDAIEARDGDAAADAMLRTIGAGHAHAKEARRGRT
jgi:DNA-binding FadR family transcriptional regulator